jgi:hypothetical protein
VTAYAPAIALVKAELAKVRERQRGILGRPEAEELRERARCLREALSHIEEAN